MCHSSVCRVESSCAQVSSPVYNINTANFDAEQKKKQKKKRVETQRNILGGDCERKEEIAEELKEIKGDET